MFLGVRMQGSLRSAIAVLFSLLCAVPAALAQPRPEAPQLSHEDFRKLTQELRQEIASSAFTAASCKEKLDRHNRGLFQALYQRPVAIAEIEQQARNQSDVIHALFELRLAATEKFRALVAAEAFSDRAQLEACGTSLKVFLRNLRGWEDIWGLQYLYETGKLAQLEREAEAADPAHAHAKKFKDGWPGTLVNPQARESFRFPDSLENGDVLLSRGNTFTGAVISRIGSIDNQFSHIAIVYRPDGRLRGNDSRGNPLRVGAIYVVEAVLNEGLRIIPLEEYLSDSKTRAVVFRFERLGQDCGVPAATVAARAAELIARKASETRTNYNFSMEIPLGNLLREPEHFCSQSVGVAFAAAFRELGCGQGVAQKYIGPNRLEFPIMYTPFNPEGNALVRTLGLRVQETFAPADVEVDPRLRIVAEWRDFSKVRKARHYDSTLTAIFHWMEEANYHFQSNLAVSALAEFGQYIAAQTEKMPANTPAAYVEGTMLMYVLMEMNGARLNLPLMLAEGRMDSLLDQFKNFLVSTRLRTPAEAEALKEEARVQIGKLRGRRGLAYLVGLAEDNNFPQQVAPGAAQPRRVFFTDRQLEIALEFSRAQDCQRFQRGEEPLFHDFLRANFSGPATQACPADLVRWWDRGTLH